MKKKLLPALLFLLVATPSCIFVVSETDECEYCRNQAEHHKQHDDVQEDDDE